MSDSRRSGSRPRVPAQKARRIQADNQVRGQRARTRLERNRNRHRSLLERQARNGRLGQGAFGSAEARDRWIAGLAFATSVAVGALFGWPALDAAGLLGDGTPEHIERIWVQGNRLLSSRDVAAATGVEPGQRGADVQVEAVSARLRAHPWIRDARVMRLPTGKLLVAVEEREPVALLAAEQSAGPQAVWRLVDEAGTPFDRTDGEPARRLAADTTRAWPRLRGGESLADGEAHTELTAALALSRRLDDARLAPLLGGDPIELHLPRDGDPEGWVLDPGPGRPRVILGRDQLAQRIDRLEALLLSQLDELRGAVEIDLRFADRAVLRSHAASS
jgi:cell division septal protein FtsQ